MMNVFSVFKKKAPTKGGKQSIFTLALGMANSEDELFDVISPTSTPSPVTPEAQSPHSAAANDLPSTHILVKSKQLTRTLNKNSRTFTPVVSNPFGDMIKLLHRRVVKNDLIGLRSLLETQQSCNYEIRNPLANNCTLLHTAAQYDSQDIIKYLLDNGYNSIEDKDDLGATPLFYACAHHAPRAFSVLLERGAQVNAIDHFGNTPLLALMRHNRLEEAELLLRSGADIHIKSFQGDTVLHYCVSSGSVSRVKWLLDHGASLFRTNAARETPLFSAVNNAPAFNACIEHLTEKGDLYKALMTKNDSGRTVLHKCAEMTRGMQSAILLCMIVNGICKAYTIPSKETCSTKKRRKSWKNLIKINKNTDEIEMERDTIIRTLLNAQDNKGNTPFHRALTTGNDLFVQFLSSCIEADMGLQNDDGDTPVHIAVRKERREIVELLMQSSNKKELRKMNRQSVSATEMCKANSYNLKDAVPKESIFLMPIDSTEKQQNKSNPLNRLSLRLKTPQQ